MDIFILLWILCAAIQLACGINCTSKSTSTVTRTITMTMLNTNASHGSAILGVSSIYNGTTGVIVITGNLTNPLTTSTCAQNSTDQNTLSLAGTSAKVTDSGFNQTSVPFPSNVGVASEEVSTTSTIGSVGFLSSGNTKCISGTDVKSTVTLTNIMTLTSTIVVPSMNASLATDNNELMSTMIKAVGSLFTETTSGPFAWPPHQTLSPATATSDPFAWPPREEPPVVTVTATITAEGHKTTTPVSVPATLTMMPTEMIEVDIHTVTLTDPETTLTISVMHNISINASTTFTVGATNASDSTVTQPTAFNSTGLFISFAHTTASTVASDPFSWASLAIHTFQPTHVASKTTSTKTIMVTSTVSSQATPKVRKGKKTCSKQYCDSMTFKTTIQDLMCGNFYNVLMVACVSVCLIAILL